jgi:hypothetical protein
VLSDNETSPLTTTTSPDPNRNYTGPYAKHYVGTMENRVDIPGAPPARDAAIKPLPVAPSIPILGSAREMLSDAPGFVLRTAREIGPIFRIPSGRAHSR